MKRLAVVPLIALALVSWHINTRAECVEIPAPRGERVKPSKPKPAPALLDPIPISGAFCGNVVMFANLPPRIRYLKSGEFWLELFDADRDNALVRTIHVNAESEFNVSDLPTGRYRLGYVIRPGWIDLFKKTANTVEITRTNSASCEQPVLVKLALVLLEECGESLPSSISPIARSRK